MKPKICQRKGCNHQKSDHSSDGANRERLGECEWPNCTCKNFLGE